MTIEEILARLQAILDTADGRTLTDAEATEYEALETTLAQAQRTQQIRARNTAYNMPAPGQHLPYGTNPARPDDGLERAFEAYLRTGQPNQDISGLRVTGEQGVGTSGGGGYTVPPAFRQKLVEVMQAYGGIAAEVDSFSTGNGNPVEFPSLDDTDNQGDITAEGAVVADGDDLTFGTVALGAYKYTSAGAGTGLPLRVSVELIQDSAFDVAGLVSRALGTRIARKQSQHWVNGTGTGQPLGIVAASLTSDNTLATSDTLTYQDFLDTDTLLDPEYEQNAAWVMNKTTWNGVRGVVDDAGRPIVMAQAAAGIGTAPARELLGRRVVIDQGMPTYTATGAYAIVYGDLREAYVIRRVAPPVIVVNPYTRASYGQIEYTGWERADGTVQNRSAYTITQNV